MSAAGLPSKRDVARALLLKGTVLVHLDPRLPDVVVPQWLSRQPQLVLQLGLDMPVPIPDLRVDDAGVYGTLSFSRAAFTCSVPWDAVFAIVGDDGRGMVWPGSMPQEIAAEVEREVGRAHASGKHASGEEEGAIDELSAPKPARARSRVGARSKPGVGPTGKKRPKPQPPSLELIAGEGEGEAEGALARRRRGDVRTLPSYLRVVK